MDSGEREAGRAANTAGHVWGTLTQVGTVNGDVRVDVGGGPARGAAQTLLTLPSVEAGFTGREVELERVLAVLDPEARGVPGVVVSQGMGGIGKTQLALAAGHEALRRGWFAGALFVDLHGYTTPVDGDRAVESFLHGLDVPARRWPDDPEARRGLYRSALEERSLELGGPILVVADNASEAAQVVPLVPGRARHRLLTTSRDRFASHGWRRVSVDHLPQDRAVRLLAEALRVGDPDDPRVADQALARVARACAGLPLALRVCAALLGAAPDMTVVELARTLEEGRARPSRLRDGSRSPHTVFEQSRARLAPEVAELLALLGLAPGPDVSTEAVAVLAGTTVSEVVGRLRCLAAAHLVTGEAGRWRMHDLVADYAASLSAGEGAPARYARARTRLFDHYTARADHARLHLVALPGRAAPATFADRVSATEWLDAERAVLIDTVHEAHRLGQTRTAAELPVYLNTYLKRRRDFTDLVSVHSIAIDAASGTGDAVREGIAWNNLGAVVREQRRFGEAVDAHERARVLFVERGDVHGEAVSCGGLGAALIEERRFAEAMVVLRRALAMLTRVDDAHRAAIAWNNLGVALREEGRYAEAIEAHEHALRDFHRLGDAHRQARVWVNLGAVAREERRFDGALEAYARARDVFGELGDTREAVSAQAGVGTCLREVGRTEEALALLEEAAEFFAEEGDPHSEGWVRHELGLAWVGAGEPAGAVPQLERAVGLLGESADPHRGELAAGDLARARAALPSGEGPAGVPGS
ncbi:tetratricopeptide repeat protein [Nocardiopsis sp. NPDC006938]|uniref:tetratricopeptide repeat protein n=1 Tax=Nocardiopsis sp. NPDC006938 TaxID=3364337 RepID=UPI0036AA4948